MDLSRLSPSFAIVPRRLPKLTFSQRAMSTFKACPNYVESDRALPLARFILSASFSIYACVKCVDTEVGKGSLRSKRIRFPVKDVVHVKRAQYRALSTAACFSAPSIPVNPMLDDCPPTNMWLATKSVLATGVAARLSNTATNRWIVVGEVGSHQMKDERGCETRHRWVATWLAVQQPEGKSGEALLDDRYARRRKREEMGTRAPC